LGKHRIAIASTDRLTIYKHFGQADAFEIVEAEADGAFSFAETRILEPACVAGTHSISSFDRALRLLADCEAIVCAKIGPGAAEYLVSRGMRVFEAPGVIERVAGRVAQLLEANSAPESP